MLDLTIHNIKCCCMYTYNKANLILIILIKANIKYYLAANQNCSSHCD